MKNKKTFLFAFLSFLIVGCDSIGGTTLKDGKGNKYIFKDASITCDIGDGDVSAFCEGSAIKKDILGKTYVVEYGYSLCRDIYGNETYNDEDEYLLCSAAKKLGKF